MDDMGGAVEALKEGFQIEEIHNSAYQYQREVENQDRVVVGVNQYQSPTPPIEKLQTISPSETKNQLSRLAKIKSERDNKKVQNSLAKLKKATESGQNTMPAIIECVESYATVGEISDVFRNIFGEQTEFTPF